LKAQGLPFDLTARDLTDLWRRRAAIAVMTASGFAGLGYQIVWTQQSALWLGHESAGMLAVVTAFFAGLAVGALLLGSRIERSPRPLRWYAGCELIIGAWSLVLAIVMPISTSWLLGLIGVAPTSGWQWIVAFCGTFVMLLPATAAMGATVPAMERLTAQKSIGGRSIATLYAANTFGAVLGVLAIAFWLAPEFGLTRTAYICVALNLACGVISLMLFSGVDGKLATGAGAARGSRGLLFRLAISGLLGIGYEVLVVRVLSQVTEDTVYTFAMLLAIYLTGTAYGAFVYQRGFANEKDSSKLTDRLLCAVSAACLIGTATLWSAGHVQETVNSWLGPTMGSAIAAEATVALITFGLPTIAMGALFSHLCNRANSSGVSFGQAIGVNTLGAAAAPVAFGVLAFPLLGPKVSLLAASGGYLVLSTRRFWRDPRVVIAAVAALALAIWAPPLAFIDVPEGGRVTSYQDGVLAAVSVVEDADGVARLRINNRQQEGSSATRRVDARQALLPILLHEAPQTVLFLGLGTGVTAASAAEDPLLDVDAVELLPEVIAASAYFTGATTEAAASPQPRLPNLIQADARRYVRTALRHYDVIVADNFHPARSGSGSLYTVEHFTAIRERLADKGIFCQWLPLHQLDLETLRSIVQSFIKVYPSGWAMLASNSLETPVIGLVAGGVDMRFDADAVAMRLVRSAPPERINALGIEDEYALLGSFIADSKSLRKFAGVALLNTDDHPVVAYRAPRITYVPDSLPRDRLIGLLRELSIEPDELIDAGSNKETARRLVAYWTARNRFIVAGRDVRPSADVRQMLSQVREPLLSILRISPDFRPAYDPLVRMGTALAQIDAPGARELLTELMQAQPARSEARSALLQMGSLAR
jgi:spermidine synthase